MICTFGGGTAVAEHFAENLMRIFNIVVFVVLAWLTIRFALPWLSPLIIAYFLAALMEKPVQFLLRFGWKRKYASALLSVCVLGLCGWGLTALIIKGVSALTRFSASLPELMQSIMSFISDIQSRLVEYVSASPDGVSDYLDMAINALTQSLYEIPSLVSQLLLNILSKTAQSSPGVLLFAVTAGIGSFMISASYPGVNAFLLAQLPLRLRRRLNELADDLKGSFGGMLRAQLILMCMTFFELLVAFLILKIDNAFALALFTAVVDALPVFGSGTVLLPWAAYCLISDKAKLAIALAVCWVLVNVIRSLTQAKLMGDQIGLNPLASLLAVYVGWRVWSVAGMLVFPLLLALLCRLNEKGIVKLWQEI